MSGRWLKRALGAARNRDRSTLNDRGLLPEHEIVGVLRDAAATHENAVGTEPETERHRAVADLINAIIAGGNSVRRL
ncbi:hypothetical protein [Thalassovita gelatinovora]|uniref:hypothetical protein n=1 Tax=Thalassovita gelatinovora TaxID=53501 RepID=UPI0009448913